ncbi:MAG: hypothetical protein HZC11_04240 [Nitrospirae bacterium]|nr:hypothetical protein [Nitrospirota bacterium]
MIISVTGAHGGVGKTTLCCLLLREFKGLGAIKFTKTRLYTSIIDDIKILKHPGKDTALLLEAGAEKVIWIQSPEDTLGSALQIALGKMSGIKCMIVEGNSPVDFLAPNLLIFIVDADGEIKPSAIKVSKKADIIVINSKEKVTSPVTADNAVIFWIDLQNKRGELKWALPTKRLEKLPIS